MKGCGKWIMHLHKYPPNDYAFADLCKALRCYGDEQSINKKERWLVDSCLNEYQLKGNVK